MLTTIESVQVFAGRQPSSLAGSVINASRIANTPVNMIPIKRNGKDINHMTGHARIAKIASGQHIVSSISQRIIPMNVDILL